MLASVLATALCGAAQMGITKVELVDDQFRPHQQRPTDSSLRFAVRFRVVGGTTRGFTIRAILDGDEINQALDGHQPGDHTRIYTFDKPLADKAELLIVLDPENTSGVTNNDYRTFKTTVPVLHDPAAPSIQRVNPRVYLLKESLSVTGGQPGAKSTAVFPPVRSSGICHLVSRDPAFSKNEEDDSLEGSFDSTGRFRATRSTMIRCFDTIINLQRLRSVTWQDIKADQTQSLFLKDGTMLDVDHPKVKELVSTTLGANFKETLVPVDAALKLFRRIRSTIRYEVTDIYQPSRTLAMGKGQCASGNRLFCALMRHIGIPARTLGGFFGPKSDGGHEGHRICEVYFAGHGWVPIDATPLNQPRDSTSGFGNFRGNNFYVTWVDDSLYECGFGPSIREMKAGMSSQVRFEMISR